MKLTVYAYICIGNSAKYIQIYTDIYTLRTIRPDNTVVNTQIGNQYTVIHRGNELYDEYIKERQQDPSRISCLVESSLIDGAIAIFNDYEAYIMTDDGKTLEKLTERKGFRKFEH